MCLGWKAVIHGPKEVEEEKEEREVNPDEEEKGGNLSL